MVVVLVVGEVAVARVLGRDDHLAELAEVGVAADGEEGLVEVGVVLLQVLLQLVALQLGLLLLVLEHLEARRRKNREIIISARSYTACALTHLV